MAPRPLLLSAPGKRQCVVPEILDPGQDKEVVFEVKMESSPAVLKLSCVSGPSENDICSGPCSQKNSPLLRNIHKLSLVLIFPFNEKLSLGQALALGLMAELPRNQAPSSLH